MIRVEEYNENLVRTYSDAGFMIERDGIRYDEAVDPANMGRTYTETDEPVGGWDAEASIDDMEAALKEAGVI